MSKHISLEEAKRRLEVFKKLNYDYRLLAEELNTTFQNAYGWVKVAKKKVKQHNNLLDYCITSTVLYNINDDENFFDIIEYETEEPYLVITFSSDWHLGSLYVDYEEFKKDLEFLKKHKEIKIILVGDLIDNFIKFSKSVKAGFSQILSPKKQEELLFEVLNDIEDRIIAMISGNHDADFSESLIGSSIYNYLNRKFNTALNRCIIKIKMKNSLFFILAIHKSRFNSYRHKLHSNKQEYANYFPADIVVIGHKHNPDFEYYTHYEVARKLGLNFGGKSILIRTGTYKTKDDYSKKFWSGGRILNPTVLLVDNPRDLDCFETAEKCLTYLKGLKKKINLNEEKTEIKRRKQDFEDFSWD